VLQDITIIGSGRTQTIIDGNGVVTNDRVVEVSPGASVEISNLTIRGGKSTIGGGGGIRNGGTLRLSDVLLTANVAAIGNAGSGIANSGSLITTNTTITGNTGITVGLFSTGSLEINSSTISANSGGGIVSGGTLLLADSYVNDHNNSTEPEE
jgi:hypothetical protein